MTKMKTYKEEVREELMQSPTLYVVIAQQRRVKRPIVAVNTTL